ncbi:MULTISPECIES: PhzF family phenazine biosynthesis protein [unclassified Pseudoalteromonas]|uniref:PhzF family phenazine biosynthesis protein n=1 Tax=unclassified Pseudoalteromonas TaxID=194690 RepID=UPI0025736E31|nr:PhzF family phenazine biosynthesis protein [Pseudoalteromonas sp. MM1]BED89065.1 hypothetical protein PspMM1_15330 [Pseudoalteromonas sp. MM1]
MQAKAKRPFLSQRRLNQPMLRYIKHLYSVPVFSSSQHHLAGSSALIVIYTQGLSTRVMQKIASNSQHPASVFINENEISRRICNIRWFNQTSEIKRCGHGTLAAAKCLLAHFGFCPSHFISNDKERFKIKLATGRVQLQLAAINSKKSDESNSLCDVFSHSIKATYSTAYKNGYTVILFKSMANLKHLEVNFTRLAKVHNNAVIALQIDSTNDTNASVYFRYFAPQFGINEDTATGSAVSIIAPLIFRLYGLNKVSLIQQSPKGALLNYTFSSNQVVVN